MIRTAKQVLVTVVLAIICASTAAFGAANIEVEKKGSYIYWLSYKDASGASRTTVPQVFKGKTANFDPEFLPAQFTAGKLYVMNKRTGNTAIVDYAAPRDPKKVEPVKVKDDDFENVRDVRLRIISEDGAPLESAIVEISDGNGSPAEPDHHPGRRGRRGIR